MIMYFYSYIINKKIGGNCHEKSSKFCNEEECIWSVQLLVIVIYYFECEIAMCLVCASAGISRRSGQV